MVWFSIQLGKFKVKYTPIPNGRTDYPYCDENGNVLSRVSGKMTEKGYYLNEKTGEKFDKALRLVKGKAVAGFTGRIKEVEDSKVVYCDEVEELADLSVEDEYLGESQELYDNLTSLGKALKFGGWTGNGFNAKTFLVTPSKVYKGFLEMRTGHRGKIERARDIIMNAEEIKQKAQKLADIELTIQKVNKVKVEDMIEI